MNLKPYEETFVLHFGEMGGHWGFNRTVAQILALLVVQPEPLSADGIAYALSISRGNVSMGIKELQSWHLLELSRKQGDRKDYFKAKRNIWELAKTVLRERRKRELDPTLSVLRSLMLAEPPIVNQDVKANIQELADVLESLSEWTDAIEDMSEENLKTLVNMGSHAKKLLELKKKFTL